MTVTGIIRDSYNRDYVIPIFLYIVLTSYAIAYFFYLIAFGSLIVNRNKTTASNQLISKYELSLLIQSLIICGYKSIMGVLWTYYSAPNKAIYFVVWIFTVLQNGYNPFMYYAMNKKLRKEVNGLLEKIQQFGATVGISPDIS
uniref:G-protein coupled receptors family 1 profile domain-containing protein n=1 Tax=Acrobeloides nanus TaxID=290746 RepID=A0A914EKI6_9BILA